MKTINGFDECLAYVTHLRVVQMEKFPGWIPIYQEKICKLCDSILRLSGQHSWYHKTFIPFNVVYHRDRGSFTVYSI